MVQNGILRVGIIRKTLIKPRGLGNFMVPSSEILWVLPHFLWQNPYNFQKEIIWFFFQKEILLFLSSKQDLP